MNAKIKNAKTFLNEYLTSDSNKITGKKKIRNRSYAEEIEWGDFFLF